MFIGNGIETLIGVASIAIFAVAAVALAAFVERLGREHAERERDAARDRAERAEAACREMAASFHARPTLVSAPYRDFSRN